jgi:hypothetical protein
MEIHQEKFGKSLATIPTRIPIKAEGYTAMYLNDMKQLIGIQMDLC